MTENRKKSNFVISSVLCVLIAFCSAISMFVLLKTDTPSEYRYYYNKYKVGMICDENLYLNRNIDIVNKEATEKLKKKNSDAVRPVFVFSIEKTADILGKMDSFRKVVLRKNESEAVHIVGSSLYNLLLKTNSPSSILDAAYEVLLAIEKEGYFENSELEKVASENFFFISLENNFLDDFTDDHLIKNVFGDIIESSTVSRKVDDYVSKLPEDFYSISDKYLIEQVVLKFAEPNVFYDSLLTSERREKAVSSTTPVVLSMPKGKLLLERNRVITPLQMQNLRLLVENETVTVNEIISKAVICLFGLAVVLKAIEYYIKEDSAHRTQDMWIISIACIFTCAAAFAAYFVASRMAITLTSAFLPKCFMPVLITMLTGRRMLGLFSSLLCAVLLSCIPDANMVSFFYLTLCSMACCCLVRFFNKRIDLIEQWFFSEIVTSLFTLVFMYVGYYSFDRWYVVLAGNAFECALGHLFLSIIVPVIEKTMNLPTAFRLHELAYSESPLLRRLSQSAPGTYRHSCAVAELASDACKAIGANALLARVGSLYHDIGKSDYPEYFVENQNGENKHDDLSSSLSVSIIKSHVKIGADKAREAGLPAEIIDIIANHHGNDLIRYFYNEAVKQAEDSNEVSSVDYSYSNSAIPESKECAIVMLADSIEAAARSIQEPTTGKFSKLIKSTILGKINRGQLDHCPISMKELDIVGDSFLRTLSAQYHSRIEYPNEEKNK